MWKYVLVTILTFVPAVSNAAGFVPCDGGRGNPCQACHLAKLVTNVFDWLSIILGILFVLIIVVMGLRLVSSVGAVEAKTQSRRIIASAIVGYVIFLSVWFVVDLGMKMLVKDATFNLWETFRRDISCVTVNYVDELKTWSDDITTVAAANTCLPLDNCTRVSMVETYRYLFMYKDMTQYTNLKNVKLTKENDLEIIDPQGAMPYINWCEGYDAGQLDMVKKTEDSGAEQTKAYVIKDGNGTWEDILESSTSISATLSLSKLENIAKSRPDIVYIIHTHPDNSAPSIPDLFASYPQTAFMQLHSPNTKVILRVVTKDEIIYDYGINDNSKIAKDIDSGVKSLNNLLKKQCVKDLFDEHFNNYNGGGSCPYDPVVQKAFALVSVLAEVEAGDKCTQDQGAVKLFLQNTIAKSNINNIVFKSCTKWNIDKTGPFDHESFLKAVDESQSVRDNGGWYRMSSLMCD